MASEKQAERRRFEYLLGLSNQAEQELLESEYFDDDNAFQDMLTAEDDLIDAYVREELSANERREFEKRFLTSPQGRERVHFARTLAGTVSRPQPVTTIQRDPNSGRRGFFASLWAQSAPVRAAAVMASIIVVAAFAWLLVERGRMRNELQTLRADREKLSRQTAELQQVADTERAKTAETEKQLADLRASVQKEDYVPERETNPKRNVPRSNDETPGETVAVTPRNRVSPPVSVAFDLSPGNVRSRGGVTLPIPNDATVVVLRLATDVRAPDETYRANIETADGRVVWSASSFKSTNLEHVELPPINASKLRSGDYVLFLQRMTPDGSFNRFAEYSFRVSKN